MEISQLYEIFKQYPSIVTDTRNIIPDSIFFALKGTNFNGNEYARQAIDKGCRYAVVDEKDYADESSNILLVDNSLKALQDLAHYHRSMFKIPVIGITGTNGKTTSKELITAVLSEEFNVLSTIGNFNNHIGVPLTLLRMSKQHEIAVIEMGASHVGEIRELAEIADPNYGLITNVGHAHIEGFGSFENVIKAKGELYDYIRGRKDGKIFVDNDNTYLKNMLTSDLDPIYYGGGSNLFVTGCVVSLDPFLTFKWKFSRNYHTVATHLIGEYNLTNTLAAVTIGKYFGVRTAKINKAISEYMPTNYRSQLQKTERNTLIIDAYNANPTSMQAALGNFAKLDVPNKALILGDMRELGNESETEHQKIADMVSADNFKEAYFIGENFSHTRTDFPKFAKLDDFAEYLKKHPLSDKYILIKGSRGLQLEKCVDFL
ncbi:MAG TPA: UDP-N-acetylmuramoyl-tripeptide--D-alanyl-D-alanine ligase [Dysgonomonas sp.]|nr:UDP-N-acetylmuramoyl-tripeptide--D-alanyl-D-alanine ligase [Dysgonomonas sp.]